MDKKVNILVIITVLTGIMILSGCIQENSQTPDSLATTTVPEKAYDPDSLPAADTTPTTLVRSADKDTDSNIPAASSGTEQLYFFGIEEDFMSENDIASLTLQDIRDLNVKYVRTLDGVFSREIIEPKQSEFNFSLPDYAVSQASDAGVSIIATLYPYATWDEIKDPSCKIAQTKKDGNNEPVTAELISAYRCNPSDWDAYRDFLTELVERYDGDADFGDNEISDSLKAKIQKNPILFWEINNEVNFKTNAGLPAPFIGDLSDYTRQLKNSYLAIKESCPDCTVIIAAPEPAEDVSDYYDELSSLGADTYFDMYNLHARPDQNPAEVIGRVLEKPVVYTETGGGAGAEIARDILQLIGNGVDIAMFSRAPDTFKFGQLQDKQGSTPESFFESALLNSEGKRTAQFNTIRTLTKELEYFTQVEKIDINGVEAYKFDFEDRPSVYVYCLECGSLSEAEFSPGFSDFAVRDLSGKEIRAVDSFTLEKENMYFITAGFESTDIPGLQGDLDCSSYESKERATQKQEDKK